MHTLYIYIYIQILYIYIYLHVYIHIFFISIAICVFIYIYYILTFKDVNSSFFTFKGGVTPNFTKGLLPPRSKIQFHVPRKTWHAWQVAYSKPSSFSKTFSYNGDTNCEESHSQLKCALEWLWVQHTGYNKLPGVKVKNISLVVLSLDVQCFLTYIYIYIHSFIKKTILTHVYIYIHLCV